MASSLAAAGGTAELHAWWLSFRRAGFGPSLVVIPLYAACTLAPLPRNVLSVATGAVFGFSWGFTLAYAGATLGALTAFYLARRMGRETARKLGGRRFAALNTRLGRNNQLAVLAARLAPLVPFTGFNYLAGLTDLRVRTYAVGTLVGIIPGTAVYVGMGAYAVSAPAWSSTTALGGLGLITGIYVLARWVSRSTLTRRD